MFYFILKLANKNRIKYICKIEDSLKIVYTEKYMQKTYECNLNNIKAFCIEISAENNAKIRYFSSKVIIIHNDDTKEFLHENYDINFLNKLLNNANNIPNFSCKLKINNFPIIEQKIKSLIEKYNIQMKTE